VSRRHRSWRTEHERSDVRYRAPENARREPCDGVQKAPFLPPDGPNRDDAPAGLRASGIGRRSRTGSPRLPDRHFDDAPDHLM
jgi:hypothetical protein